MQDSFNDNRDYAEEEANAKLQKYEGTECPCDIPELPPHTADTHNDVIQLEHDALIGDYNIQ